jgi:hypothetical protein
VAQWVKQRSIIPLEALQGACQGMKYADSLLTAIDNIHKI